MSTLFAPSLVKTPTGVVARPYQIDAMDKVWAALETDQSTFIAMPTGTGKTYTFTKLASTVVARGKRVLILVDREELVGQTVRAIANDMGFEPTVEQGENRPSRTNPVVVAMVQSLASTGRGFEQGRFKSYFPEEFGLVIVDECHLSIVKRTRAVLDHFLQNPECKLVGVTATPSRADGRSMAQVYKSCAYRYEIRDAIDDGWLVPILGKHVDVQSLDLSVLPKAKRDFTDNEIGTLMEQHRPILEVCGALIELCRGEPTLVFGARVSHAAMLAAQLNNEIPHSARWISGNTPEKDRRYIIDEFRDGRINYLCNVDVLTVGFDAPVVRNVAIARPTKSWARFVQCVGRGTRPLPGLVDGVEDAEDRRAAIAASAKPCVRILSFGDRAGGVDLVGPEDVLAGSMADPRVVKRAKELRKSGDSLEERVERAEREVAEKDRKQAEYEAAPVRVKAKATTRNVDLFHRGQGDVGMNVSLNPATHNQLTLLKNMGVEPSLLRKLQHSRGEAGKVLAVVLDRKNKGLASWRQCRTLRGVGYDKSEYNTKTYAEASEMIDRVKANGWKKVFT